MLTDFTFKDTGRQVKIRKVSPLMAADIQASIPAPEAPKNLVDYGEPKGKVWEENRQDPEFIQANNKRMRQVLEVLQRATILRGVVVEGEEWKAEVKEYRDFILHHTGKPVEEPEDLVLYVLRICVGTDDDIHDLLAAITTRSQPTSEAVEAAKSTFRGSV